MLLLFDSVETKSYDKWHAMTVIVIWFEYNAACYTICRNIYFVIFSVFFHQ